MNRKLNGGRRCGRSRAKTSTLEVLHPDAAGIDIGNESHYVAVPPSRDTQPVRRFGCTTAELKDMAVWLKQCRIRTVAMQSTGVYWVAAYDIFGTSGSRGVPGECPVHEEPTRAEERCAGESVADEAAHVWTVGRKFLSAITGDSHDAWTYWRQRNDLVQSGAGRHSFCGMQKALTQMNVQLANVLSDISGVTGQAIIKAILAGERDPHKLAQLRDRRVKASQEQIARYLEGNWQEDLLFVLKQEQEAYEFCQQQIAECDRQLAQYLQQREESRQPGRPSAGREAQGAAQEKRERISRQFDLREGLFHWV